MKILHMTAVGLVAACVGVDAGAELVRCTSKNGSSVVRRDKCDSPDDMRTPVTVKSPVTGSSPAPPSPSPAPRAADEALSAYNAGDFARARGLFDPLARQGDARGQARTTG